MATSGPSGAVAESADSLSVRELLRQTVDAVGSRHEARWLCEVATGLDGAEFDESLDDPATVGIVAHLDRMVSRYQAGEPLQYVLGRWSFRHLDLAIDPRVLIPRPETEVVAGVAIDLAALLADRRLVADLGTGSGAIGLSLATELPLAGTTVWMTDVSEEALAVARANLAGIGSAAANVRIGAGSWFDALPVDESFDVIVSNPPYVADDSADLAASVAEWEPAVALFADDGLRDLRLLIAGALHRLRPGGWLVLEIGADQGDAVCELMQIAGYVEVEIRPDLSGRDRVAVARTPG